MAQTEVNDSSTMIQLPKAADIDTMKNLIRVRYFFDHAKLHGNHASDFDIMLSVHNIDNAIEYFLRIIIAHLKIEEIMGTTINTAELAGLFGTIQKFLKEHFSIQLSFEKEVKHIRVLRNSVQHGLICPIDTAQTIITHGEKFLQNSLHKIFGFGIDRIVLSTLAKNDTLRTLLEKAEYNISNALFFEAVVNSRDAFEYAAFIYRKSSSDRIRKAPAIAKLKDNDSDLYYFLEKMDERLAFVSSGVDFSQYRLFSEYMDYIPKFDGSHICLQRPWEKADADFCHSFVSNAIILWQANADVSIEKHDLDARTDEMELDGIRIGSTFPEHKCLYINDNNIEGYLFYVENSIYQELKGVLAKGKIVKMRTFIGDLGEEPSDCSSYIQVISVDYNNIISAPAIWEVVILYKHIPFTFEKKGESRILFDDTHSQTLMDQGVSPEASQVIERYCLEHHSDVGCIHDAFELNEQLPRDGSALRLYSEALIADIEDNRRNPWENY